MEPVPGYEIASWERGYGDFRLQPDLAHAAPDPLARRDGARPRDVVWHDGSPVGPSPRQLLWRRSSGPRARVQAEVRLRARVLPLPGELRRGARRALPWADAVGAVHPRLPPARDDYDEPLIRQIRTGMQAAGIRSSRRRARRGPGQHEINFRFADALARPTTTSSTRTAPRRSRTRRAARSPSWRSRTTSGSARPATSTASLWADGENAFAGETRRSGTFWPAGSRARASSRSSSRRTSTRTSATPPGAGRRRRSPGVTTTAPAASASSATAARRGWRRASRAPTSTRTSRSLHCSRPGCTGSRPASSRRPSSRATPTSRTSRAFRRRSARRSTSSSAEDRAAGVRGRGRRPLSELRAHRAASVRPGRHLLRARAVVRAGMKPVIGITTYVEPASWGQWNLLAALIPVFLRARGRGGGRARAAGSAVRRRDRGDARCARRCPLHRWQRSRPGLVRRRRARADDGGAGRARLGRARAAAGRARARHAGARDLSREPGAERRPWRRPRPASPRRART